VQFEYTPPQTEFEEALGGYLCINAFGRIESGDDEAFIEFLERLGIPHRTPVYINSPGGDVETAINIGRIIRDRWFSTHIGQLLLDGDGDFIKSRQRIAGQCLSAATLLFLGGRLRYLDENAEFGVHQFSFRNPSPDHIARSQILSAKIARYVTDMGIHAEFVEIASATPGNEIQILSLEELEPLGVITGGETPVTWSLQAVEGALYARGERDNLYGHHKMLFGFAKPDGFFVHAVIESQGREQELMSFPLVELAIGEPEELIVDLSTRCSRTVDGAYTNIVSLLTVEEARAIAYSTSFGIRVRGGPDAGMFLGVGPMSTADAGYKLKSLFAILS